MVEATCSHVHGFAVAHPGNVPNSRPRHGTLGLRGGRAFQYNMGRWNPQETFLQEPDGCKVLIDVSQFRSACHHGSDHKYQGPARSATDTGGTPHTGQLSLQSNNIPQDVPA